MVKLKPGERLVTAWPEYCRGPGWSNTPIWIILRGQDGTLHQECIQPEKQTAGMLLLFGVCAAAHEALVREIERSPK